MDPKTGRVQVKPTGMTTEAWAKHCAENGLVQMTEAEYRTRVAAAGTRMWAASTSNQGPANRRHRRALEARARADRRKHAKLRKHIVNAAGEIVIYGDVFASKEDELLHQRYIDEASARDDTALAEDEARRDQDAR